MVLKYMVIVFAFLSQLLACNVIRTPSNKTIQPDFVGIWQMCYDPNGGADEADNGYLIIEPNGTYLRMTNDYLREKLQSVESGNVLIKGNILVFYPKQHKTLDQPDSKAFKEVQHEWKQYELQYVKDVMVVLKNRKKSESRSILRWKDGINYGYARIY